MINTNIAICYKKVVKRVNPKSPHHKKKNFFFLILLTLYLYEVMDVHWTHCGHFITYVSQVTTLYTLNLHSAACPLHLNKTGRRKKKDAGNVVLIEDIELKVL